YRTYRLSIPLERPLVNGSFAFERIEHVLLELELDGLVGLGHAFAFERHQAESIRSMVVDLAQSLLGQPIDDAAEVWDALWGRLTYIGHAGPPVMALAAVDTAVWDLLGKRSGLPLYRLLGGERTELPLYATGGWLSYTVDELVAEARRFAQEGFSGYKLKVGH